jgi:4-hydroxy-tetrahydrodipicolinate reductase
MTAAPKIALGGAPGRMGVAVLAAASGRSDVQVVAVFGRNERAGESLAGFSLIPAAEALRLADVVIDFSTAAACARLAASAAKVGRPALVIGATGFSADDEAAIAAAGRDIPIVKSGNYSIGVNVLAGLLKEAARRLPATDWDIEVFEAHHRRKVDAPSGTALMLAGAAAAGRGVALDEVSTRARDGVTGPRPEGAIGFSVMRGGGIVGEHGVVFAAEEEILTFSHSARDRGLFARGAIEAAIWVAHRAPGVYSMAEVLGFD